jgi:two-component system sensor histidine kinase/response regulator
MGGEIWVESQLGHGSTFHFTADVAVQSPACVVIPAQPEELRGLRVLVVDDNLNNRQVLIGMLTRWGMDATAVESGREALRVLAGEKAGGRKFSLMLLDAHLPEMDGFTLAAEIKKADLLGGATMMMLTSGGQPGDAARCQNSGISGYFPKPVRQTELLQGITIALKVADQTAAPLITRHTVREAGRRLRVLLVEDNEVNQKLAQRLLERRGYVVLVAGDGRQALAAMDKDMFDIVLMDVQMPEMDGYEATMAIRERERASGRRTPVVAMTAHARKADEERCTTAGMDGFVSKPIRTSELVSTIERLTGAEGPKSNTKELELKR